MAALEMIDLSMPIGRHFRWATDVEVTGDIGAGDDFRVTRLRTTRAFKIMGSDHAAVVVAL